MAEPIWLDTQTVSYVAAGDRALEGELLGLIAGGNQLLITPKVQEELFQGNPFKKLKETEQPMAPYPPDQRTALERAITRLNIQVDRSAGTISKFPTTAVAGPDGRPIPAPDLNQPAQPTDRPGVVERGFQEKPPQRIPQTATMQSFIGESDSIILSQVSASARARGLRQDPRLFTCDNGVANEARRFNVTAVRRTTPPPPPSKPSSSTPGTPAAPASGGAKMSPATINAIHSVIRNGLTTISQTKAGGRAKDDWDRAKNDIFELMHESPGMGVVVVFYFRFNPGVNSDFNDTWAYDGMLWELSAKETTIRNRAPVVKPMSDREERRPITLWLPPDVTARAVDRTPRLIKTPEEWAAFAGQTPNSDLKEALEAARLGAAFSTWVIKLPGGTAIVYDALFQALVKLTGAKINAKGAASSK